MQSVTQAVLSRHSVRAFLPTPVPRETIEQLLATAARAPSGGNLQPWHVDVVAGAELDALKEEVRTSLGGGIQAPEFQVYPADIRQVHGDRRRRCGEDLYASIGIGRDDKAGRWAQFMHNYALFGAPVGLFFSIDRNFDRPQWAHLGMFIQTIMLLAEEAGLATCAQESWAAAHTPVSRFLQIPAERMLYCGLALGHEDKDHPINRFRTHRAPVSDFATFRGF
jgi:nitroreductase